MTIRKINGGFIVTFRNISYINKDRLTAMKKASAEAFRQ